jgi:flagellar hook-associated protein 2
MTTSISGTGAISSAGIGSGLDVNGIISKLMSVEQAPLTQLQTKAATIQTNISAYGAIKSAVSAFRDAASTLAQPTAWSATAGTSSDPTAVGVATSAGAPTGSYSILVQNLAASQSTVSGTFASGAALVGAGSLHVDLGTWSANQAGFTPQTGSTGMDIAVTADDTLATLSQKINDAGAGISAAVVTDSTGARLVLSSSTTGTTNGFRVTATDSDGGNTDATGLSGLAFDPAGGSVGSTITQAAGNAQATINGLPINSATNNLVNVLQGLTITLTKASTTPVQVSVAQDTKAIKDSVTAFVKAYNDLSTLISTDVKYDAGTSTAGPLQGDSAALSLQRQMRSILSSSSTASTAFSTLSQVGLQLQVDGTIKVNDAALSAAIANPTQIKALFTASNIIDPANSGFAQRFRSLGDAVLGIDGLITSRTDGLNKSLTRNHTDQDAVNQRLADTEARLRAQYTALDAKMATISTLSTYITQQIANWNKNTS